MYLFNNTPIQTRFDESDKKIASELNKITDNELLNCDLQKIADRIEQQYSIICDMQPYLPRSCPAAAPLTSARSTGTPAAARPRAAAMAT